MTGSAYIQDYALLCPAGGSRAEAAERLFGGALPALSRYVLTDGREVRAGALEAPAEPRLRAGGARESRNNRIALAALQRLSPATRELIDATDPQRRGVVIGTSTSGIAEGGEAVRRMRGTGTWDDDFDLSVQELGDPAAFLAGAIDAQGPTYAISTACTSGAKAMISAARLIGAGICDVVLCGGFDTLCDMTLNGFGVLEALSVERCNPFSVNRAGIHIGEGGALFVLSATPGPLRVAGWGESSDAHHISAPDPEGRGADDAMRMALRHAGRAAGEIGYLNLHGTATRQNDQMEAQAVMRVFGGELPCSSTKPLTGHMLGAAGACEAAFLTLALEARRAPGHRFDGERDPELAPIGLVPEAGLAIDASVMMSCNYAFGGNNVALILERC